MMLNDIFESYLFVPLVLSIMVLIAGTI